MKTTLLILLLAICSICQGQEEFDQVLPDSVFMQMDSTGYMIKLDSLNFDSLNVYYPVQIKDTYEVFISLGLLMEYKISHSKATFDDFIDWLVKYYNDEKKRIKEMQK